VAYSLRSLSVLITATVAMLLATVAAAAALQYPPESGYGVTCTVDGPTVSCTVVGADAGEQLAATAICDGTVRHNMTLVADAAGEASFSFVAGGRSCEVSVLRASSGAATTTVTGVADGDAAGTPVASGPSDQLPLTGGEVSLLLAAGILLIAGGLLTLRRREDARVSATT
jgi:LPXTG-motif cell wall-anchored protein